MSEVSIRALLLPNRNDFQPGPHLRILPTQQPVLPTPDAKSSLHSLPALNGRNVDGYTAKTNTPFPTDSRVLKDLAIDDGEVYDSEHDREACGDSPEEEAIAPDSWKNGEAARGRRVRIQVE